MWRERRVPGWRQWKMLMYTTCCQLYNNEMHRVYIFFSWGRCNIMGYTKSGRVNDYECYYWIVHQNNETDAIDSSDAESTSSFFEQDQFNHSSRRRLQLCLCPSCFLALHRNKSWKIRKRIFVKSVVSLRRKRKKRLGLVSDSINSYVDFSDFWNGSKWLCTNSDTYRYVKSSGTFPALMFWRHSNSLGEKPHLRLPSPSTFLCLFWAGNSQHITRRERSEVAFSAKNHQLLPIHVLMLLSGGVACLWCRL